MKSILVIQTAFIGDVILSTAAIEQIRELFPEAKIDMLVKKGNESLLEEHPHLRNVFTFDKKCNKIREIWRLTKLFRLQSYDIAFNFHRFASSGLLTVLSRAKKKYGFSKNPLSFLFTKRFEHKIGNGQHEIERNFQMFSEFSPKSMKKPKLYPLASSWEKTKKLKSQNYFCMAPCSIWFTKQMPEEKWVELSKILDSQHLIYMLGASSDFDHCERIRQKSKLPNLINLCGELSLLDTAALMNDAQRNFVNDSAPLHIASAMNARVTAFFCSTIPEFGFGPLSDEQQIVDVQNLSCRPCGIHGHKSCPLEHFQCARIDFSKIKPI